MARTQDKSRANSTKSTTSEGKMSRSEAGHLGGIAPHKCRGFQCQQDNKTETSKTTSSKSRSK